MEIKSFRQLEHQLSSKYDNGDFSAGLIIIDDHFESFENYASPLYLWKVHFYLGINEPDKAILTFADALSKGYWFSTQLLTNAVKFELLQGLKEFQNIIEISAKMEEVDQKNFLPQLVIRPKDGCGSLDNGCPLFYFLHDNDDQAINHLPNWHSLSNKGWIVGMPQSNNLIWTNAYRWKSEELFKDELLTNITNLHLRYSVDVSQVMIGGYGYGGELALRLFLEGEIIGDSFVFVNPKESMFSGKKSWDALVKTSVIKNKRFIVIANKNDTGKFNANLHKFVEKLNLQGIESHIRLMDFQNEMYPENFIQEIPNIIKLLVQNN